MRLATAPVADGPDAEPSTAPHSAFSKAFGLLATKGHATESTEPTVVPNDFKPACERAGLDGLVFHELRHTFATLALESRALTMYKLSVAMGHESEAITNKVYAHLRKKDYSSHRAAFSAHIAAAIAPPAPVAALGR